MQKRFSFLGNGNELPVTFPVGDGLSAPRSPHHDVSPRSEPVRRRSSKRRTPDKHRVSRKVTRHLEEADRHFAEGNREAMREALVRAEAEARSAPSFMDCAAAWGQMGHSMADGERCLLKAEKAAEGDAMLMGICAFVYRINGFAVRAAECQKKYDELVRKRVEAYARKRARKQAEARKRG